MWLDGITLIKASWWHWEGAGTSLASMHCEHASIRHVQARHASIRHVQPGQQGVHAGQLTRMASGLPLMAFWPPLPGSAS